MATNRGTLLKPTVEVRKARRQRYWRIAGATLLILVVVTILIWTGYSQTWTGFKETTTVSIEMTDSQGIKTITQISPRTLWDWFQLLIIPGVLAGAAFLFNRSERTSELKIAEKRAELERKLAEDRLMEETLQSYLDKMAELLIEHKLLSTDNNEAWVVARIRTLTALRRLDGVHKGLAVRFLYEAELPLNRQVKIHADSVPTSLLFQADLRRADLSGAYLCAINWGHLDNTRPNGFFAQEADFSEANLCGAQLIGADMLSANLSRANLSEAVLLGAFLNHACE